MRRRPRAIARRAAWRRVALLALALPRGADAREHLEQRPSINAASALLSAADTLCQSTMTTTSPKRAATFDLASASSKKARTIDDTAPPPVAEQEPSHVEEPEPEHVADEETPPMGEHETRFMHARQSVQERLVATSGFIPSLH